MKKNDLKLQNGGSQVIDIKTAKKIAGEKAVLDNIKSGMKIGIGSGSTIEYSVNKIGELYRSREIKDIVCIPTSFQAEQLIIGNKLPLGNLNNYPILDIAIDGADEIDSQLNCIKGGGGCAVLEKTVDSSAKNFIIVADYTKVSKQ